MQYFHPLQRPLRIIYILQYSLFLSFFIYTFFHASLSYLSTCFRLFLFITRNESFNSVIIPFDFLLQISILPLFIMPSFRLCLITTFSYFSFTSDLFFRTLPFFFYLNFSSLIFCRFSSLFYFFPLNSLYSVFSFFYMFLFF